MLILKFFAGEAAISSCNVSIDLFFSMHNLHIELIL